MSKLKHLSQNFSGLPKVLWASEIRAWIKLSFKYLKELQFQHKAR